MLNRISRCASQRLVYFTEISKYTEILRELNMHKQCVPGSLFSAHTREARFTGVGLVQDCTKLEISGAFPLGFPFSLVFNRCSTHELLMCYI